MPDILRYAGFASDPTPEGAAPSALFHVDIASTSLDVPSETEMSPPSSLGRARVRMHRAGFYAPSGDIEYALDIRTIAYFLYWTLGGYHHTTAVAPALGTHEVWGSNQSILPMFASFMGKDIFEQIVRGCSVNSLKLTVEGEFAIATMNVMARKDELGAMKAIDELLLPDEYPLAFHEVTVQREGADFSPNVKTLTLTIENGTSAEAGRSVGSRFPRRIPSFERNVQLAMSLYFDSTDELEAFWGAPTAPSLLGATDLNWNIHFNAGVGGEMDIAIPVGYYLTVPTQPSGRDEVTQDVNVQAVLTSHTLLGATEIDSEILVTVQNGAADLGV